MRKILFLVVCCLCLCGCTKNAGYQVSELIPNTDKLMNWANLKGTLKNISNTDCKTVQINVEFSSGTIKEKGWVWIDSPEIGESVSFNSHLVGVNKIKNIENYKIKFKNIECWVKKDTK